MAPSVAIALSLLVLAALLAVSRFTARRRSGPGEGAGDSGLPDGETGVRYHALSVRFGLGACQRARALHGKRFLAAEAPILPLDGCTVSRCQCRIVHHRDRRIGDDRRSPFQGGFGGSAGRIGEDRRLADRRRGDRGIGSPTNQ